MTPSDSIIINCCEYPFNDPCISPGIRIKRIEKGGDMYTYDLLETGCYYLVKQKEDSPITMIKVAVESDHCLFVQRFDEPMEAEWKLKKDTLHDIIECLSDEAVKAWETHYLNNEDAFYEGGEEE